MALEVRNSDLCAYVDQECDDDEKQRIVAALAASPQLTDRLSLWRRNDAALRLALAGLENSAPLQIAEMEATGTRWRAGRPGTAPSGLKVAALAALAGGSGFAALAFVTFVLTAR
ncbi:MAG: hypothetical protein Q8M31_11650 [Beijerinckiaceae bacterium]|nr:hypothetical protein [Beijerinckiaceae bacterium]